MKTLAEINEARAEVCRLLITPGLNELQRSLLAGMSNALVWAAGDATEDTHTMNRLIAGELIAPGKDPAKGLATLENITRLGKNPTP